MVDKSVHMVCTSPPYYGLRDYGVKDQIGLEPTPEEYVANLVEVFREVWRVLRDDGTVWLNMGDSYAGSGWPGSQRDNKVTKDKGAFKKFKNPNRKSFRRDRAAVLPLIVRGKRMERGSGRWGPHSAPAAGDIKAKDLIGVPWMVAFALRADGWYLRSDIIWFKDNPMPESATDRPTKSHEYLFLLTKNGPAYKWLHRDTRKIQYKQPKPDYRWIPKQLVGDEYYFELDYDPKNPEIFKRINLWEGQSYFYDMDAIREPHAPASLPRAMRGLSEDNKWSEGAPGSTAHSISRARPNVKKAKHTGQDTGGNGSGFRGHSGYLDANGRLLINPAGRNKRTVWQISTYGFSGAHFATFPPKLVEPCIKAGTSERGVCPKCGAPWERILAPDERRGKVLGKSWHDHSQDLTIDAGQKKQQRDYGSYVTKGWQPTCDCGIEETTPATVLDPFAGSGTTLLVARALGRHGVGLDLSMKYLQECAVPRLSLDALKEWDGVGKPVNTDLSDLPMFGILENPDEGSVT